MPQFDYIQFEGSEGRSLQPTPPTPDEPVNRRELFWRSALVAGAGAAGVIMGDQAGEHDPNQNPLIREQLARTEGFAAGADTIARAAMEADNTKEYVNEQIISQLVEGKVAMPLRGKDYER